jgi:hypothetical protein
VTVLNSLETMISLEKEGYEDAQKAIKAHSDLIASEEPS